MGLTSPTWATKPNSFEEFQAWYSSPQSVTDDTDVIEDDDDDVVSLSFEEEDNDGSWISLSEVRRLTGLGEFSVEEVFELFAEATDDEGLISREMFDECFNEIIDASGNEYDEEDEEKLYMILDRLYDIFDTDDDGVVEQLPEASRNYPGLKVGDRQKRHFDGGPWGLVTGFEGKPEAPTAFLVNDPDTGAQLRMTPDELEKSAQANAQGSGIWMVRYGEKENRRGQRR